MSDTQRPTDSIGWKIVQKHAPFFKPSDLAKAIDDAVQAECKRAKQQTCDDIVGRLPSDSVVTKEYGYHSDEKKYGFRIGIAATIEAINQYREGL